MAGIVQFPNSQSEHPDMDTLAAFVDQALWPNHVSAVFAHLSECQRCRDSVRVQAQLRSKAEVQPATARQQSTSPSIRYLKIAAAAVCAILSGIAFCSWMGGDPQPHMAGGTLSGPSPHVERNWAQTVKKDVGQLKTVNPGEALRNSRHSREGASKLSSVLPRADGLQFSFAVYDFHPGSGPAHLPKPFMYARLNQSNKLAAKRFSGIEESRKQNGRVFAVKTAFGERWFYWALASNFVPEQ
jgi:hypothetical protein